MPVYGIFFCCFLLRAIIIPNSLYYLDICNWIIIWTSANKIQVFERISELYTNISKSGLVGINAEDNLGLLSWLIMMPCLGLSLI